MHYLLKGIEIKTKYRTCDVLKPCEFTIRAVDSRGVRFSSLSVYPHDVSITDTARITKLDTEMFQDES